MLSRREHMICATSTVFTICRSGSESWLLFNFFLHHTQGHLPAFSYPLAFRQGSCRHALCASMNYVEES